MAADLRVPARAAYALRLVAALVVAACARGSGPADAPAPGEGSAPASSAGEPGRPASVELPAPPGAPPPPVTADAAAPPPRPPRPLNVVLILVDSMRADMPWAGYPRPIAPFLTKLEAQSVSYTRAYSLSSYTARSVGGLLAGRVPSALARTGTFFTTYRPEVTFFPELLDAAGVHAAGAFAHKYFAFKRGAGLAQGFRSWKVVQNISWDETKEDLVTSQALTPLAIAALDEMPADARFFLYVHYMDPHHGYVSHRGGPRWGHTPRDRYDEEMLYTDGWIEKLLARLEADPRWPDTVVIVSADHGDAFGEHGQMRHAFTLWEPLVRVPLFFHHLPGAEPRRIAEPRSHIDLARTILDLAGVEPDPALHGVSLVPELYGAAPERRPVLCDLPKDDYNPRLRALVDGDAKLIVHGTAGPYRLFDLAADPGELHDLARREPERLADAKRRFTELWATVGEVRAD